MKKLSYLLLLFLGAPGHAELIDPRETLGIAANATEADINQAFRKNISALMDAMMKGDPRAIRRSRTLANARMALLASYGCETMLAPSPAVDSSSGPANDNDFEIGFLNKLYPNVYPAAFHLLNDQDMRTVVERLAQDPRVAVESLTLTYAEVRSRFPDEVDPGLLAPYQKLTAGPLGRYLRRRSLDNPSLVRDFESEIVLKLRFARHNEPEARRLLTFLHDLSLSPGPSLAATVRLLDDPRNSIAQLAEGVVYAAARKYGLPLSFEEPLLKAKNPFAIRLLLSSRKSFSDSTNETILQRLGEVTDAELLRTSVHQLLLNHEDLRTQAVDMLKARWANTREDLAVRLFAAEVMLDNGMQKDEVEYFLLRAIPYTVGSELYQMANWCYGSSHCPPSVKAVIQNSRLIQLK